MCTTKNPHTPARPKSEPTEIKWNDTQIILPTFAHSRPVVNDKGSDFIFISHDYGVLVEKLGRVLREQINYGQIKARKPTANSQASKQPTAKQKIRIIAPMSLRTVGTTTHRLRGFGLSKNLLNRVKLFVWSTFIHKTKDSNFAKKMTH